MRETSAKSDKKMRPPIWGNLGNKTIILKFLKNREISFVLKKG